MEVEEKIEMLKRTFKPRLERLEEIFNRLTYEDRMKIAEGLINYVTRTKKSGLR